MTSLLRLLRLVLAVCLLVWIPQFVPGATWSMEGQGFSLGLLFQDGFAWPVFSAFVVGGLLGGGVRGSLRGLAYVFGASPGDCEQQHTSAHGALLGAARGLLFGSCLLLTLFLIQVYVRANGSHTGVSPEQWNAHLERVAYIRMGGYLVLPVLTLVLWPCLAALDQERRGAGPFLAKLDALALVSYGALAYVMPLCLLVMRKGFVGEPNAAVHAMLPTASGLDLGFVAWSLFVVLGLSALALGRLGLHSIARPGPSRLSPDLLLFGAGVTTSMLVRVAGMQAIALGGGSGNPAELQAMGGRMLAPVAMAMLLIAMRRILARKPAPKLGQRATLTH